MKYNEDKILKEIGEYITSTYGQHYSKGKDGFQVLDFGGDKTSTSGTFTIQFPTADASNAILRLA